VAFAFEKLQVYQKAIAFADAICTITRELPRGHFILADQLSRAALSIVTNLAEGNGRFTKADGKNFFTIARGSAQECVPLFEIAARRGFVSDGDHHPLKSELEQIARMLCGLINGLDKRKAISWSSFRGGDRSSAAADHPD
jgi:four helix bundle protein